MKNNGICFPHPVMGIGDDILPHPSVTASKLESPAHYNFRFEFGIENDEILELIKTGKAVYACEVTCSTTFLRRIFTSQEPIIEFAIGRREVAKRIEFEFSVTAIDCIPEYTNKAFHPDFQGFKFNIEPGDVLALFKSAYHDVEIQYDRLRSATSFMKIVHGTDENNVIYNIDRQKIEIQLPPEMYNDYKMHFNGPGQHANIFHSSLAFNALVYALSCYKEDDHKELLWARTIKYRIDTEEQLYQYKDILGLRDQQLEILKLAQALLANPYKRLFQTMHNIIDQPEVEEE